MEKAIANKDEVLSLKSQLERSLKEKEYSKSEEILDTLQHYKVPEKLQKESRINILLTRLITHENEAISIKAKKIISSWRGKSPTRASITKEIKKDHSPSNNNNNNNNNANSKEGKGKKPKSTSEPLSLRTSSSSSPSLSSSASKLPSNPLKTSGNSLRNSTPERTKFTDLLVKAISSKESPPSSLDIPSLAADIEENLHLKHGGDYNGYLHHFRSISYSIKDKSNEWLHRDLITGMITAKQLVDQNVLDLASAQRKAERKTAEEEMNFDRFLATDYEGESDLFTCGRCKKSRCTYKQLQTRSADEPMTSFIKCLECGHRWKQN